MQRFIILLAGALLCVSCIDYSPSSSSKAVPEPVFGHTGYPTEAIRAVAEPAAAKAIASLAAREKASVVSVRDIAWGDVTWDFSIGLYTVRVLCSAEASTGVKRPVVVCLTLNPAQTRVKDKVALPVKRDADGNLIIHDKAIAGRVAHMLESDPELDPKPADGSPSQLSTRYCTSVKTLKSLISK